VLSAPPRVAEDPARAGISNNSPASLETAWRMTESIANSSPSTCQPVDTLAAVDNTAVDRLSHSKTRF
jgi:hypothetical protein